jgi:hypothetical protein
LFVFIIIWLFIHAIACLQSHILLLDFNNNSNNQSLINQYCQCFMTYTKIVALLSKMFCPSNEKPNVIDNNYLRITREINAGSIDITDLQTTINDHRIMIEYLFNNSINQTLLAEALYNHSLTSRSLRSWRDSVDIFCIALASTIHICLFICRTGFYVCDRLVALLC